MASKRLVALAKKAARASAKASEAIQDWVNQFECEFGHTDISDALVEVIDYSTGGTSMLTPEFIDSNSEAGRS